MSDKRYDNEILSEHTLLILKYLNLTEINKSYRKIGFNNWLRVEKIKKIKNKLWQITKTVVM